MHPAAEIFPLPTGLVDALSSSRGHADVLAATAKWVPKIIAADRASAAFVDADRLLARGHWRDGRPDVMDTTDTRLVSGSARENVTRYATHKVFDAQALLTSTNALHRKLYDAGLRWLVMVPMMAHGRAVGVKTAGTHDPKGLSQADASVLEMIGKLSASQLMLMTQIRLAARLAETDTLTGLANRARLMRVLGLSGTAFSQPDGQGRYLGVLTIDLDRFKEVNDNLGHAAGDAVLRQAAERMQAALSPRDLVARIGGDEFVVVTRSDPEGRGLYKLGRIILEALCQPMTYEGRAVDIGASIGGAVANRSIDDPERLMSDADIALYEIKRNGRAGVQVFDERMRRISARRARLFHDLRQTPPEEAFVPYFEPVIEMRTGRLAGLKVLPRWNHPEFGLLDPDDFLDRESECELGCSIDAAVRRKAVPVLEELGVLRDSGLRIACSVSDAGFKDSRFIDIVNSELKEFSLDAHAITFELSEAALHGMDRTVAAMHLERFEAAGLTLDLDGFGAGQAHLGFLATAPLRAVKLDPSLVAYLPGERGEILVASALRMASDLGLATVATGVETADQFARLRAMGCDYAQGPDISEPLSADELAAVLSSAGSLAPTPHLVDLAG